MIICPQCGFDGNSDDALFCARCAAPLTPEAANLGAETRGQTLAVDTVLQGHYTILKKLSEGGMGAVYLAQDTKLFNKLCVIKEMLPFYTNEREKRIAERNFEREAKTLAHLRHPGIPEIYDYFIEEGRNYLVMAFVEGQNLQEILDESEGGLPEKDVILYGVQLTRVLAYLAERNPPTMHRDIKPANIILEKTTGQVKLVDFGIARESLGSERLDATKSIVMGTQGFAPPEQFSGRATPASDVYALGATLHYLLTGIHPLKMATPFHFDPVRTFRPEVSPRLDELILEMVRPDPSQRPAAQELKERFERLTGTQVAHQAFVMRSGVEVYSVGELVQACDKDPVSGQYHLRQGHFRDWFLTQNRHDLAEWAEQCLQEAPDEKVALEWFLRGVDPSLPPPELSMTESVIDFGEVERDSSYSLLAPFTNGTRGYLLAAVASLVPWLKVETEYVGCYAGETGQIQLTLDTANMPEGFYTQNALAIAWEDQQTTVPVQMNVIWPPGGRLEPERVDVGMVWEGQAAVPLTLTLNNTGGSEWVGRLQSTAPWITLQQDTFRIPTGAQLAVPALLYPDYAPAAARINKGSITLHSNSGSQVAVVAMQRAKPWYVGKGRLRRWLAYSAPALLSTIGLGLGASALGNMLLHIKEASLSQLIPALMALGAWLLGLMLAAVFVPALDEMEDFHHGGDLRLDIPARQFSWPKAIPLLALLALLGGMIGFRLGSFVAFSQIGRLGYTLLGLLLGSVAGIGIVGGSSDYLSGAKPLPGLDGLIRRPVALGLTRTFIVSLALVMLAQMSSPFMLPPNQLRPFAAAILGLILTSDSYPYLPKRLMHILGWLRPALRAIFLGYLLGILLLRLLALDVIIGGASAFKRFLAQLILLLSLPLGAFLGIVTCEIVGFDWKARLMESIPLAVTNMLIAPVIFILFDVIFTLMLGSMGHLISFAATVAILTFVSLGLTGKSQWAAGQLQHAYQRVRGMFQNTSFQTPDLHLEAAQPVKWISARTRFSDVHPFILATIILLSALMAPLWIEVLGALLWLIVLAGMAGVGFWFWRRQEKAQSSREVQL